MSRQEMGARAYCEAIGLDPDEEVFGYWDTGKGHSEWLSASRWAWYVGADLRCYA